MEQQSDVVKEIIIKINNAKLIENPQQKLIRLEDIVNELYRNPNATSEDIGQVLPILSRIGNELAEELESSSSSESSDND